MFAYKVFNDRKRFIAYTPSTVIPAKAGIHPHKMLSQGGFPLSRE